MKSKRFWQDQQNLLNPMLLGSGLVFFIAGLLWLVRREQVASYPLGMVRTWEIIFSVIIITLVGAMAWGYRILHADRAHLAQAQKVLRESEQRYRALFQNSHTVMLILDPKSGAIIDTNPAAVDFYGYSHRQLSGMNVSQIGAVPPVGSAKQTEAAEDEQRAILQFDHRLSNGEMRHVEVYSGPIVDQDHEFLYLIVHDVTDRSKVEQALRRSESTLQSVFQAAPNGIGMVRERVIMWVNQDVCSMMGYTIEELVGQNARMLYENDEEFNRVGVEKYEQIRKLGKGTVETRWRCRDGSMIDILLSSAAMDPWDLSAGVIFTATNISDLKRAGDKLNSSEERYRQLFSTMQSGFALHEILCDDQGIPCDYRFLDVNPSFEKITGLKAEQVIGKTITQVLPQVEKEWIQIYGQVALSGEPASFERYTAALGKYFDVFAYAPEKGQFAVLFMDVSERVRYQLKQDALISISRQLRSAETRSDLISRLLSGVIQSLSSEGAALGSYKNNSKDVILEQGIGTLARLTGTPMRGLRGFLDEAQINGSAVQIADIHAEPATAQDAHPDDPPFLALVPLVTQSGPLGALMVNRQAGFSEIELQILSGIAEYTAIALQRVSLDEMTRRQLQRLEALHKIDQTINSGLDLSIALGVLLDQALIQLEVDAADVLQFSAYSHLLEFTAGRGFKSSHAAQLRANVGKGLAGSVILERNLIRVRDLRLVEADPHRSAWYAEEGFIAYIGAPIIAKGEIKGVLEIYHRSPLTPDAEWLNFLDTLAGQTALAIENNTMYSNLQRSHLELALAYDTTLEGWAKTLELRDHDTEGHSRRVTEMTVRLARAIGVGEQDLTDIRRGALLHDLGKVGIPDHILRKPGPLSPQEWQIMHQHPVYAYDLLSTIPYLHRVLEIPYCHHEKWDGSGYPRGLKGEQIPLAGRIFAVVDVWDALLSERPYRPAWSLEQVKGYIREQSGKHFDPRIARGFLAILDGGKLFDERAQTRLE